MAIPESIKQKANKIRNEVYGKDVREALASGLEEMSEDVEEVKGRQDSVEVQFQSVLDETTGKDVISAPEITAARVGADDTNHPNLKERLDTEYQKLSSQLAEKANQSDLDESNQNIEDLRNNKADKVELEGIDFQIRQINGLGTEVRNIYVDVNTGDDEQGDGSESNPFKTIQKAVDTIPKIINKDHHIICKPGTYDEEVVVQSIFGAGIFITCPEANQDPTQATGFSVVSISFYDCGGYCVVQNMDTFKGDVFQARAHIVFSRCFYGSVGKCRFDSGAKNNGNGKASVLFDGSVGSLQSNHWHNQHRCLHVINGSQVRVDDNNTSTGDSIYGMTAQAATIYKNGSVSFTAQLPEQKLQGGQIW